MKAKTKEQIKALAGLLDRLGPETLTAAEIEAMRDLAESLSLRLKAGRPRKFANDRERWAYHNERRKRERKEKKKVDSK